MHTSSEMEVLCLGEAAAVVAFNYAAIALFLGVKERLSYSQDSRGGAKIPQKKKSTTFLYY